MNLSRIATFAPLGMDGARVDVESQVIPGKARISIVGLPDGVLKEARDRVRCAIENSGFGFPKADVVVNLSPAALPKTGSGFDLAIALSILAAAGLISADPFSGGVVIGELGLDGTLRAIPGALAAATYTRERRCRLFLPLRSARAAVAVPEVSVLPFRSLYEAVRFARAPGEFSPAEIPAEERVGQSRSDDAHAPVDFGDVIGQHGAKRALEICAAGG
ncbi:MAG: ATP-binding protein, partial [Deltaproteobacteria bacterium]|nr:ATP-binding protein [Deltaproteobacteria bacterium]